MKRNLLKGIILMSAVAALSSCSTVANLSEIKAFDDDAYYTKAKAGDSYDYTAPYNQYQDAYVRNDDYYYYGDYESRIARFAYATPFDYDDDFYYSYEPDYTSQSAKQTAVVAKNQPVDAGYDYDEPVYADLGVYDAYDFGYGDYWGYDNFGYGAAFSTFAYGGGSRANHRKSYSHSNKNYGGGGSTGGGLVFARANGGGAASAFGGRNNISASSAAGNSLTFSRGNGGYANSNNTAFSGARPGGSYAVYPGRPGANSVSTVPSVTNPNVRYVRPESQNPRQTIQQPMVERASSPPPSPSSSSSSGSSGGGGASSGGGGRPVRP